MSSTQDHALPSEGHKDNRPVETCAPDFIVAEVVKDDGPANDAAPNDTAGPAMATFQGTDPALALDQTPTQCHSMHSSNNSKKDRPAYQTHRRRTTIFELPYSSPQPQVKIGFTDQDQSEFMNTTRKMQSGERVGQSRERVVQSNERVAQSRENVRRDLRLDLDELMARGVEDSTPFDNEEAIAEDEDQEFYQAGAKDGVIVRDFAYDP